jgi:yvgZ
MIDDKELTVECAECSGRTKTRSKEELSALLNRLSRIEGQVRGIKSMVEKSAYCVDILIQVSAVTAALNSFNRELLAEHIRTCVADDIKAERADAVDELVEVLKRLMK